MAGQSLHRGQGDESYIQPCFKPNTLRAFQPKTDATTIIRPIPQRGPDGNPLPMVVGMDENGPLFSNAIVKRVVQNAGMSKRFTGLVECSDSPLSDIDQPWSGLYIRIKGALKNSTDPVFKAYLGPFVERAQKKPPQVPNAGEMLFLQCAVLSINNRACNPPAVRACIGLSPSGVNAINNKLTLAHKSGYDVFDPERGCCLKLTGLPPNPAENRNFATFVCDFCHPNGQTSDVPVPMPIPPGMDWRSWWLDWDQAFFRYTYDEHMRRLIDAYPDYLVGVAFPQDFLRLTGRNPTPIQDWINGQIGQRGMGGMVQPPAAGGWQQPPAGLPGQPPMGGQPGWPGGAPAAPAPAAPMAGGWQQPAAPAPAPAAGGWQQPQPPAGLPGQPPMGGQPSWQQPAAPAPAAQPAAQAPAPQPGWPGTAPAPAAPMAGGWQQPAAPAPAAPAPAAPAPAAPPAAQVPAVGGWGQPAAPAPAPAAPPPPADVATLAAEYARMVSGATGAPGTTPPPSAPGTPGAPHA